jgi:hypothetical protein
MDTHITKEQQKLLEQANRRQQLLDTYSRIQREQGPDKAREWYECWIVG